MTNDALGTRRLRSFHELMQRRILRILLVSSPYDSFIMSEEGHLSETLLSQFVELNVTQVPNLLQASTMGDALMLIETEERPFDLVLSTLDLGDGNVVDLKAELLRRGYDIPVVALAYSNSELLRFITDIDVSSLERIFLWQGDARILLAIVMSIEDRWNAEQDTRVMGVPAILVVEDSIRFYSSFLPAIYSELYAHSRRLLSVDLNLSQKMMRMRARPKVLLCTDFEEAWNTFSRYEENVIGVVSDVEYPRAGALDSRAGFELCERVSKVRPDVRLVLQSSNAGNAEDASRLGASFLLKGSQQLLADLRLLLVSRFGFGDFQFRGPDGRELRRAHDLKSLAKGIGAVPDECLVYHAHNGHFSNWLKARSEFATAERLKAKERGAFADPEELRGYLLKMLETSRMEKRRSVIAEFDKGTFDPESTFTRIGGGAMGGKARGAAFANRILQETRVDEEFQDVDIYVPPSVVLGTNLFDDFMAFGMNREFANGDNTDREIEEHFLGAPFPRSAIAKLRDFLQRVKYPVAVRSSSLLEDSLSQPFAGVYETYMLANNGRDVDQRWEQLAKAIKKVYASVFCKRAKTYLSMTNFRLEEEKMAVMVQELVGNQHGDRFYPDFAGVARSHNDYPEPGQAPEDGVAAVALGLGHAVVGGDPCLRFSPKHPRHLVSFSSVEDALSCSQREFHALDLSTASRIEGAPALLRHPLEVAEEDGVLDHVGSTYLPNDDRIVDGIAREGIRLVSFAQTLKHGAFPLARILEMLLARCTQGTGAPVEIEFAGSFPTKERRGRFAFLQLRPLSLSRETEAVEIGDVRDEDIVCRSSSVLGNGLMEDIHDIIIVDIGRFDRGRTPEMALQIASFDAALRKERRPYLLVSVGRLGSADPFLGVPVTWSQICGAQAIIEVGLPDLIVAPSQGTHFFQNLTSCGVGYFTVNPERDQGTLDWDWLLGLPVTEDTDFVRHVRLDTPLIVKLNGVEREGVVLKR